MKKGIVFTLFVSFCVFVNAQNPVFRHINNLNGLPSNIVYDIAQDETGFIWLAHDKGLSRYDGKFFRNFKNKAAQGKSLSNISVYQNKAWCQDFSGNFYRTEHDTLAQETNIKSSGFYTPSVMNEFGKLFYVSKDSFMTFDLVTKEIKGFQLKTSENPIIFKEKNGVNVFVKGTIYDSNGTQNIENFTVRNLKDIFFIKSINNKIFGFSKNKSPYIFPLSKSIVVKKTLKEGLFIQNVQYIDHEIWVSTSTGTYCFNENMEPRYDGFCFFEDTSISAVLKDREGNYWFSTLSRGLYFVPNLDIRLYPYQGSSITALTFDEDKNELLLGTDKNEIVSFSADNQFVKKFSAPTVHEIVRIVKADNHFFVASNDFTVLNSRYKKDWSAQLSVKGFAFINDRVFAVAYSNGIMLFAKNGQSFDLPHCFRKCKGEWSKDKKSYHFLLEASRVRSVTFNIADSTLYAATSKGLFRFSPQGSSAILLNDQPVLAFDLKVADNQVFAATFNQGLVQIVGDQAEVFLSTKQGLNSNTIYHFQKEKSKFWLIEDGFMQSYDTESHSLTSYSDADGLPRAEIKDVLIRHGKVFLVTTEGLVIFDENQNTKNNVVPKVSITSFNVNGATLPWQQQMSLAPTQNNIDIFFSVLSFKGEGNLMVRYSINNTEWLTVQQDARVLSLNALSPGNYNIKIQAFNEDGITDEVPFELNFTVQTPWYKHWFTILTGILSLIALFYSYFTRRIYFINKNNALMEDKLRLEQEVQKSMLASIKSQMNPHFLFNALNTIQAYIYTNDKENASIYLGKFSDLTRSILDMSNKETIPLSEEIKALSLYLDLEKLRFEDTLDYVISIHEELDGDWIHIPSMLIQPYVENAIKHGLLHKKSDRKLVVLFRKIENMLQVSVEDNGVGRKRAAELKKLKTKQHEPFAINANQKRLDILNHNKKNNIVMKITDKHDTSGIPIGTLVEIFIPI